MQSFCRVLQAQIWRGSGCNPEIMTAGLDNDLLIWAAILWHLYGLLISFVCLEVVVLCLIWWEKLFTAPCNCYWTYFSVEINRLSQLDLSSIHLLQHCIFNASIYTSEAYTPLCLWPAINLFTQYRVKPNQTNFRIPDETGQNVPARRNHKSKFYSS